MNGLIWDLLFKSFRVVFFSEWSRVKVYRITSTPLESVFIPHIYSSTQTSVAQSNARPTGDHEVAGSIPAAWSVNILSWRLIKKYFLRSFSPFRGFRKGSCQFLTREFVYVLVNRLAG